MQGRINSADAEIGNIQAANNFAAVTETALKSINAILETIRGIAVAAAGATTSEQNALQAHVNTLLTEIDQIAANTIFNGTKLLDGIQIGGSAQVRPSITIVANTMLALGSGPVPETNLIANPNFNSLSIAPGTTDGTTRFRSLQDGSFTLTTGAGIYNSTASDPAVIKGLTAPVPPNGGQGAYIGGPSFSQHTGAPELTVSVNVVLGQQYNISVLADGTSATNYANVFLQGTDSNQSVAFAPGWKEYTFSGTATQTGTEKLVIASTSLNPNDYIFVASAAVSVSTPPVLGSGLLVASAAPANNNFLDSMDGIAGFGGTGTVDGSITINVVNTGSSIAAQETFVNAATGAISVSPVLLAPNSKNSFFDNVAVAIGDFSAPDVGASSYIQIKQAVTFVTGANPSLRVQTGPGEGNVVRIELPTIDTTVLGIADLNVLNTTNTDSAATLTSIDMAQATIGTYQASIFGFVDRLTTETNLDLLGNAVLNGAVASIRDINTAHALSTQIRAQVDSSLAAFASNQTNLNYQNVETLFAPLTATLELPVSPVNVHLQNVTPKQFSKSTPASIGNL